MNKNILRLFFCALVIPHYSLCDLQISPVAPPQAGQVPLTEEAYITKKHEFHDKGAAALTQAGQYYENRAQATKPVDPLGLFSREMVGSVILTYAGLVIFFAVLNKIFSSGGHDGLAIDKDFSTRAPETGIDDIAGKQPEDFKRVVDMLQHPESYTRIGAKIPRTILLYGLPGTGKTVRARAIAGELNAIFFEVSASSFLTPWQGSGANNIEALFKKARKFTQLPAAPSSKTWFSWFKKTEPAPEPIIPPKQIRCVIFIDEIDSIAQKREHLNPDHAGQNPVYQLLTELERPENENIMIIAATNFKEALDDAFVRRFNHAIEIPLPDAQDLEQIFTLYVHKNNYLIPHDVEVDFQALWAAKFSGDDIKKALESAALMAGSAKKDMVGQDDIDRALGEVFKKKTGKKR